MSVCGGAVAYLMPMLLALVMRNHVGTRGLDTEGLVLLPENSPEFSRSTQRILGKVRPPAIEALLPYSALLVNTTKKRLIFYAIRWTSTSISGTTVHDDRMYYNLTTLRGGYAIGPGESSLVTVVDAVNRPLRGREQWEFTRRFLLSRMNLHFQQQAEVIISLDLAIFANGEVVGPDVSGSLAHARARLDASRDLNAQFEERARRHEPITLYVAWLRELANTRPGGIESNATYSSYRQQLAEGLLNVYAQGGNEALRDRLQQCSHPEFRLSR